MADRDEPDDAVDSLSWPDTSRPIVSNSLPAPRPAHPPGHVPSMKPPAAPRRRRRWPLLAAGALVVAAVVVVLLIVLG